MCHSQWVSICALGESQHFILPWQEPLAYTVEPRYKEVGYNKTLL